MPGAELEDCRGVMAIKPRDLRERTFIFACDIVAFCVRLSQTPGAQRQISGQLLRAGTSVGANAEEAKASFGRRDFAYRNAVVLREARESRFWLRLIAATKLSDIKTVEPLLAEANELVGIYTATVKKAKEPKQEARNSEFRADG
jgi:four helix bundle protein